MDSRVESLLQLPPAHGLVVHSMKGSVISAPTLALYSRFLLLPLSLT